MTDRNDLGKIIRQQRVIKGLRLKDLSASSGVSASHLGRIERGERSPSARTLRKLAQPLGFGESELFTLAGFMAPPPSTAEKTQLGQLDPYVASVLSPEPVEVQRAVVTILSVMKSLAKASQA